MLKPSKPAVHFHSNVLHRTAEPLGRPEHYNISSITCHEQAAPEGPPQKAGSFVWSHRDRTARASIRHAVWPPNVSFCYDCCSKKHCGLLGSNWDCCCKFFEALRLCL
jgi:hypothetical protein